MGTVYFLLDEGSQTGTNLMGCYQGSKTEVGFWLSCRVINTSIKCLFLTTFVLVTRADSL